MRNEFLRPYGAESYTPSRTRGCAALRPWLQSSAPSGPCNFRDGWLCAGEPIMMRMLMFLMLIVLVTLGVMILSGFGLYL